MRCNYRGACCKEASRTARHYSAAGQRRKPVAALVVDWFYETASFQVGSLFARDVIELGSHIALPSPLPICTC
jgi:hypothetical protein